MTIDNMPNRKVSPATGPSDQPAGVQLHHILGHGLGVKLTPGLIEHNPLDDAGVIASLLHPSSIVLFTT